jgi:hypothetical protein
MDIAGEKLGRSSDAAHDYLSGQAGSLITGLANDRSAGGTNGVWLFRQIKL